MKLNRTIEQAMPLLLRDRVIDAVLRTQNAFGSPVTAQEVRAAQATPLMRHTRALTEICHQIAALGFDDQGRTLCCAGKSRIGLLLWWVQETPAKKKRAAKKTSKGKAAKKKRAGKKRGRA